MATTTRNLLPSWFLLLTILFGVTAAQESLPWSNSKDCLGNADVIRDRCHQPGKVLERICSYKMISRYNKCEILMTCKRPGNEWPAVTACVASCWASYRPVFYFFDGQVTNVTSNNKNKNILFYRTFAIDTNGMLMKMLQARTKNLVYYLEDIQRQIQRWDLNDLNIFYVHVYQPVCGIE